MEEREKEKLYHIPLLKRLGHTSTPEVSVFSEGMGFAYQMMQFQVTFIFIQQYKQKLQ